MGWRGERADRCQKLLVGEASSGARTGWSYLVDLGGRAQPLFYRNIPVIWLSLSPLILQTKRLATTILLGR
jgi:hypothetical protein